MSGQRSNLRTVGVIAATLILVLMTVPASVGHDTHSSQGQGQEASFTWVDDGIWEMLEPHAPSDAEDEAHEDLYIIPHIDPDHGPHFEDPDGNEWDHVVRAPPGNQGSYNAVWHVFVVGTSEADLDGDGVTDCDPDAGVLDECLTSVDKIEEATEKGLIDPVDTDFAFECPVRPHV